MSCQFFCSKCGKKTSLNKYINNAPYSLRMRLDKLCFDCAYWANYIENPIPDTFIVSGWLYTFHPEYSTPGFWAYKNPNMIYTIDTATGDAAWCNDYKRIARVPQAFKDELKDRFKIVSKQTFKIVVGRVVKECLMKGCWDRYNCYWYNFEKAEPNRPWNVVPKYHKAGYESCESFIDKETMYIET